MPVDAADRPTLIVSAAILAGCAIVGFVGGGVMGAVSATTASRSGDSAQTSADVPWDGAVTAVPVGAVQGSCQADVSRDAGGNRITYEPANAVDGDPETAWRCSGDGSGETLTLDFGGPVEVAEVAMIPGYAKVDPVDGTDRYPENRRITEVTWRFDDDSTVTQEFDPDPENQQLQAKRLVPTETTTLTLEIVSSTDAARDRMAISEVVVSAPDRSGE